MTKDPAQLRILSIDIGGSHIKATILNYKGELQMEYDKVETPHPATPDNLLGSIKILVKDFPAYDCISSGFPGYVRDGIVRTAPNLGSEHWADVNLAQRLEETLGKPAKVVNDADMQGLGVVDGKGLEMVVTLGTGFGTALLLDGHLLPHLEYAHQPITKSHTFDNYIGDAALDVIGKKKWNKRLEYVLSILKTVFNYDHLYIGGGNSRKITFTLDSNIKLVSNEDGIKGGARLWVPEEETLPVTAVNKHKSLKNS
jgi:polyphosphate glucokinase